MYLMARGSALPRCTVLNNVSNKSSTNFCRVPWGGAGGPCEPTGGGGAAGSPWETRGVLGPTLPWIQPVPHAEQTVWGWGGRGTKGLRIPGKISASFQSQVAFRLLSGQEGV